MTKNDLKLFKMTPKTFWGGQVLVFQMAPTGHVTFLTKNGFFDDF
jgi:hypothetical protein